MASSSNKTDKQIRHEIVVKFLGTLKQYQKENGKSDLKVFPNEITSSTVTKLHEFDINNAVVAFTDVINLSGGSIGKGIDLYRLMQTYLLDEAKRLEINTIVDRR